MVRGDLLRLLRKGRNLYAQLQLKSEDACTSTILPIALSAAQSTSTIGFLCCDSTKSSDSCNAGTLTTQCIISYTNDRDTVGGIHNDLKEQI